MGEVVEAGRKRASVVVQIYAQVGRPDKQGDAPTRRLIVASSINPRPRCGSPSEAALSPHCRWRPDLARKVPQHVETIAAVSTSDRRDWNICPDHRNRQLPGRQVSLARAGRPPMCGVVDMAFGTSEPHRRSAQAWRHSVRCCSDFRPDRPHTVEEASSQPMLQQLIGFVLTLLQSSRRPSAFAAVSFGGYPYAMNARLRFAQ